MHTVPVDLRLAETPLLSLHEVNTYYGPIHILQDLTLEIYQGEIVALLGGNASGKSTTLKTILGLVEAASGQICFDGAPIAHLPASARVARGIAVVPENRRLFGPLSVRENLLLGAHLRNDRSGIAADLERIFALFPRLAERQRQAARTLSGGEQQMLAMARALMSRPKLILMDEPSMGLAPRLVEQNLALIQEINRQGVTVLMVEQNAAMALAIAHRGYVLQTGKIALHDTASQLLASEELRQAYLGRAAPVS